METAKKEVQIFIVEGKEFLDKKDAEEYEKEIKKELGYTFFTISHDPDLTEGRGYYKNTVIAVSGNYAEEATALKFCFDNYGTPLEFVMGVCPTPNWILGTGKRFNTIKELEEFKKQKISEGIGDYRKQIEKQIIYIDSKGKPIK
jgi:hypothetical protein